MSLWTPTVVFRLHWHEKWFHHEKDNCFLSDFFWRFQRSSGKDCFGSNGSACSFLKKPNPTIFLRNFIRWSATSPLSCLSTNDPFFRDRYSNPTWCSHLRALSVKTWHGNPGSCVDVGRRTSFTKEQKSLSLMFSCHLTQHFCQTYSHTLQMSFSLDHKIPVLWYLPCLLSPISLLLSKKAFLHSRMVLSDRSTKRHAYFAVFIIVKLKYFINWKWIKSPKETQLSQSSVSMLSLQNLLTISFSSTISSSVELRNCSEFSISESSIDVDSLNKATSASLKIRKSLLLSSKSSTYLLLVLLSIYT